MNNIKIHFGPGSNWKSVKNNKDWFCLDVDPSRATLPTGLIDFSNFNKLPFKDNTCEAIYASHTFEHINPCVFPSVLSECHRVMSTGAYIRIVIPDPVKSMKEYFNGNYDFELFKRRAKKSQDPKRFAPTLFELMLGDFVSCCGQPKLLGKHGLAHQNAWDKETMFTCLHRAGFKKENIYSVAYKKSKTDLFSFEGSYPSEADEHQRSQYFEAMK